MVLDPKGTGAIVVTMDRTSLKAGDTLAAQLKAIKAPSFVSVINFTTFSDATKKDVRSGRRNTLGTFRRNTARPWRSGSLSRTASGPRWAGSRSWRRGGDGDDVPATGSAKVADDDCRSKMIGGRCPVPHLRPVASTAAVAFRGLTALCPAYQSETPMKRYPRCSSATGTETRPPPNLDLKCHRVADGEGIPTLKRRHLCPHPRPGRARLEAVRLQTRKDPARLRPSR